MIEFAKNSCTSHWALIVVMISAAFGNVAVAGEADVVAATARAASDGSWTISVSVRHDDAGWDHFANRWEVLSPSGDVLATRVLAHPHENEQPFTRSLSGIVVPDGMTEVVLRAHDSVHGYGGAEFPLRLGSDSQSGAAGN